MLGIISSGILQDRNTEEMKLPSCTQKLLRDGAVGLAFITGRNSRPTVWEGGWLGEGAGAWARGWGGVTQGRRLSRPVFRWCGWTGFTFTLRHGWLILSCDPSHFLLPYGRVPSPAGEPGASREESWEGESDSERWELGCFDREGCLTSRRSKFRTATEFYETSHLTWHKRQGVPYLFFQNKSYTFQLTIPIRAATINPHYWLQ